MLSSKSPIEIALDIRSYERVVAITDCPDGERPSWCRAEWLYPRSSMEALTMITPESVVIVDGMSLTRRVVQTIGSAGPRLIAVRPVSEDHARSVRKILTSLYPWHESWTISTDSGRFIMAKGAVGHVYDRDAVLDMRTGATA